ncbi:MAG: dephospho-CoA kinase [Lachnospiraceae bacterium]|nr:dephospho-CoA kinase [Lachnospiraceae bacterium]
MKQNKEKGKNAVVIGITGPAGCGKSYICRLVSGLKKTLVIDTDTIAKEQMKKGRESYKRVVKAFGRDILLEDGEIDRAKLAGIVFSDKDKLALLNSLTHPPVIDECKKIIKESRGLYEFILLESALLTDSGCNNMCDLVWYIHTPKAERIERLTTTRGYSKEKIRSVMKSQRPVSFYRANADMVILNSKSLGDEKILKSLSRRLKVVENR